MKPSLEKAEFFTIFSSQGRILLSVGIESRHFVVSYHEAAAGVRAARISTSGNAIHSEKISPALDNQSVKNFST